MGYFKAACSKYPIEYLLFQLSSGLNMLSQVALWVLIICYIMNMFYQKPY